ncbi:MAG: ABC transporter ATP-binding protein [Bacillota bacterium]|jgi:peptide/nickel transport system ATP-binding protein
MSALLELRELKKYFKVRNGYLHAVDGIDLSVHQGKTLGVVGESGCGKTTLGRTVIWLEEPTAGEIIYDGKNLVNCSKGERREMRKQMQMIFQDPYSSLNPRMSVQELIAEPLLINRVCASRAEVYERTADLMDMVGLAQRLAGAYPHELDGGRRQRIGVARALALSPKFIVCDEPVSALDVSIQAQILNLLMDLQEEHNLTYMFITHDLSVVRHISDEIAVMYLGKCVERAPSKLLFKEPLHPYTRALLSAIPIPKASSRRKRRTDIIRGEVVSPINPKPGCRFAPRCPHATNTCTDGDIPLRQVAPDHYVACVLDV